MNRIYQGRVSNIQLLDAQGATDIRIVAGGVIPQEDIPVLQDAGVSGVFLSGTPIAEIADYIRTIVHGA